LDDTQIVELYLSRSENAIAETEKQYGSYCSAIAMNILKNRQDSEECVNDAFLKVWQSIPPARPTKFSAFLGKIVRNLSLDKYEAKNAAKRGGNEVPILLSELEGCIPSENKVENQVEDNELIRMIEEFLSTLRKEDKIFFIRRYWYSNTVPEIVKKFNVSEGKITMSLHRTRKKLKNYLEKRGVLV
jgi:RNA polymerase sigma-70 factor (ECF subfamily)